MSWYEYSIYSLVSGNFLIHIFALVLLEQHKDNLRNKNQRNIIAALCGCELSEALLYGVFYICKLHVSKVILEVIFCFKIIYFSLTYYFIMYLLTIDRFLVFYLNIRYNLYVTSTKLIKLIISTVTIFLATTIIFSVLIVTQKFTLQWLDHGITTLFLIVDFAYIFVVAATYTYIFMVYRQQSRMRKGNQYIRNNDNFKLLIPSLIMGTFIVFTITPELLRGAIAYGILPFNETFSHLSSIFFKTGWLIDPLIYIFYSKLKRNQ